MNFIIKKRNICHTFWPVGHLNVGADVDVELGKCVGVCLIYTIFYIVEFDWGTASLFTLSVTSALLGDLSP